jgi:hypothetical protein
MTGRNGCRAHGLGPLGIGIGLRRVSLISVGLGIPLILV